MTHRESRQDCTANFIWGCKLGEEQRQMSLSKEQFTRKARGSPRKAVLKGRLGLSAKCIAASTGSTEEMLQRSKTPKPPLPKLAIKGQCGKELGDHLAFAGVQRTGTGIQPCLKTTLSMSKLSSGMKVSYPISCRGDTTQATISRLRTTMKAASCRPPSEGSSARLPVHL